MFNRLLIFHFLDYISIKSILIIHTLGLVCFSCIRCLFQTRHSQMFWETWAMPVSIYGHSNTINKQVKNPECFSNEPGIKTST